MEASTVLRIIEETLLDIASPSGAIVSVIPREGGVLVVTVDDEYVQAWIVSVRPTRGVLREGE